jgi:(5-formylfuran-3-yl)methyl phosphate synthase
MTLMLASVVDAAEAKLVAEGGADVIDFADPRSGAFASVPTEALRAAVAAIGKAHLISAALGPTPADPDILAARARDLAEAGVDRVRLMADAETLDRFEPEMRALAREVGLIGVLFADRESVFWTLHRLAEIGFKGALLDAADKSGRRLLDHLDPPRIEAFCAACRQLRLSPWLAGLLQAPDVPRLLLVEPDVLGFRSALCARGRRDSALDPRRIALIRDLIPREGAAGSEAGLSSRPAGESERDLVFVCDFETSAEVGAYAQERGAKQRLLFNVDVSVARVAAHADDMRAIFSYDVILDAIRLVVGRGHIDFLETIAEDVAAIVLKHRRVHEVRVRVEKLDVIAGSVGVEIRRGR